MSRTYFIKGGEMYRVWANLERSRALLRLRQLQFHDPKNSLGPLDDVSRVGLPHIGFYDIATSYGHVDPNVRIGWSLIQNTKEQTNKAGTRDFINGYMETDEETTFLAPMTLKPIYETFLENKFTEESETVNKSRKVSNAWPLYHNCGDLFLDFYLKAANQKQEPESEVKRLYVLHQGNPQWLKIPSLETRQQSYTDILPYLTDPSNNQVKAKITNDLKLESEEEWLSYELALVYNQEGRLLPRLLNGEYSMELKSPFYYEPFDVTDKVHYKITYDPSFYAEEASIPWISMGPRINSDTRIFMVPQFWKVQYTFKAWYLFFTYWSFTFVVFAFTFQFLNRFPLFPRPFSLGTTDDYSPVWSWIERSKSHGRAVSGVHALEFFTPIMAMVFAFTSDGIFNIRQVDTPPGALIAVIERAGRRYYIWRKLYTERDLSLVIGEGPVNTSLISSWGAEMIGGIPSNKTGGDGGMPSF